MVRATLLGGLGRAINALVALFVLGLLARHLALDELGRFALFAFLLTLLDQVTDFGTGNLTLQRGSNDDWAFTSYLTGARRLRTRAFLVGWCIAALAVLAVRPSEPGWFLLALASPATRRFEASALALQRRVEWGRPVAIRSGAALLRAALVALLVARGVTTAGPFLVAIAATNSLAHVALHLAARGRLPRPSIAVALPRDLLRAALPLAVVGVVQLLHVQIDHALVGALAGSEELARYHVAARVFSYLVWVPVLATQAALPVLARAHARGELGARLERYGLPTALVGALALGALWPHAATLLGLAFDEPFRASAPALRALLVAAVVVWIQAWWISALVASDRGRALFVATLAALAVNVAGNVLLIGRFGGEGAAWATAVSELVSGLAAYIVLVRAGDLRPRALLLALAAAPLFWLARTLA
ncbi:MAG: polysaccharide biosynthesis C-terminal domain-containing protein [Planctomycetota bacterium]